MTNYGKYRSYHPGPNRGSFSRSNPNFRTEYYWSYTGKKSRGAKLLKKFM